MKRNTMPIHDMRSIASEIFLDREGFAFLRHESAVRDFDDDEVRKVCYPEAEIAIAQTTGAARVFIFDHTQRRRVVGADDRAPGTPRQPATRSVAAHSSRKLLSIGGLSIPRSDVWSHLATRARAANAARPEVHTTVEMKSWGPRTSLLMLYRRHDCEGRSSNLATVVVFSWPYILRLWSVRHRSRV
jgi:hypothetical protein